jgi:hypothetical protein
MWNKIVNPKTGRKVNVNSKIGKSVLKNYMKQLGGGWGERDTEPLPILSSYNVVFYGGEEELQMDYLQDKFPPLWRQTEDEKSLSFDEIWERFLRNLRGW